MTPYPDISPHFSVGTSFRSAPARGAVLDVDEIRLILSGAPDAIEQFARSSRLHVADPKGDTGLHLAARVGNLALCDLFIRQGANPNLQNHDQQTPADVALEEGHIVVAGLLSALATQPAENEPAAESVLGPLLNDGLPSIELLEPHAVQHLQRSLGPAEELDDLIVFEADQEPEDFFVQNMPETVSGAFAPYATSVVLMEDQEGKWDLDLSPASIAGEGIILGSNGRKKDGIGTEQAFLNVESRGRRSAKRAVVQTGTNVSIDRDTCHGWIEDVLEKGRCSSVDIDHLAASCGGNAELDDLRNSLQRTLEAHGFDLADQAYDDDVGLWDIKTDIRLDDMIEALEANLARSTQLPGNQRFQMDKCRELQLVEPIIRAKSEVHLQLLESERAVSAILDAIDSISDGSRHFGTVSLKTIVLSHLDHAETTEFLSAANTLRLWQADGLLMEGKRRRQALAALETLDLTSSFFRELACSATDGEFAVSLLAEILVFEGALEKLVCEHLPYVRRFAVRYAEDDDDPEDVFQVACIGLQRAAQRFDPDLGHRFLVYATYWMRQAVTRWRSDEGRLVRIPVHRTEKIAQLDRALNHLDLRGDGQVSDENVAAELMWTNTEVRQFRDFPRDAKYCNSSSEWEEVLRPEQQPAPLEQEAMAIAVVEALAALQDRQATVIRMRFGIGRDSEMTLDEIGKVFGVTRERIRQIESKGLKHLAHPVLKRRLQDLLGK
ncbi:MAG: sigma-70 family RNA polymerase sigma factor [Rhizobium sp.]|nr:sigma-70 family RNA polymerase sigma factor [Rhizobium sp.]MDM8015588.1 sigma-70 family RNA polymerase sigma factor [Rhizobium sp.]